VYREIFNTLIFQLQSATILLRHGGLSCDTQDNSPPPKL